MVAELLALSGVGWKAGAHVGPAPPSPYPRQLDPVGHLREGRHLPGPAVASAVGALIGASGADLLLSRVRPEGDPSRLVLPGVAAATALSVWSGQLAGFAVYDAVPVALWAGVIVLTALAAAALTLPAVLTISSREAG